MLDGNTPSTWCFFLAFAGVVILSTFNADTLQEIVLRKSRDSVLLCLHEIKCVTFALAYK